MICFFLVEEPGSVLGFGFWKLIKGLERQTLQVFSWALDAPIISLNNALFLVWLPDYFWKVINPGMQSCIFLGVESSVALQKQMVS